MISTLQKKVQALIDNLSSNEMIVVEEAYIGSGLSLEEINKLEAQYGIELDDEVKSFYREINGVIVEWALDNNFSDVINYIHTDYEDPIYGSVNILMLEEMLEEWIEFQGSYWDSVLSEESKQELLAFKPFDDNIEEAFIGFKTEKRKISNNLYFQKQEDGYMYLIDAKSTIEQYIDALCQSRGFYWWQDLFTSRPIDLEATELKHYISQLFPNEEFLTFLD